jgi:hypothetical protein
VLKKRPHTKYKSDGEQDEYIPGSDRSVLQAMTDQNKKYQEIK